MKSSITICALNNKHVLLEWDFDTEIMVFILYQNVYIIME